MPKPIKIMVTVEETAFGAFFNKIESMPGVIAFMPIGTDHVKAQEAEPPVAQAARKKPNKGTITDALLRAVATLKEAESHQLASAVERAGFSRHSTWNALAALVDEKRVGRRGKPHAFIYFPVK